MIKIDKLTMTMKKKQIRVKSKLIKKMKIMKKLMIFKKFKTTKSKILNILMKQSMSNIKKLTTNVEFLQKHIKI